MEFDITWANLTWAWAALFLATFPATMGLANLVMMRRAEGSPWPGALVSMEDTVKGFAQILDGKWDDVPEGNFYMKAGIETVSRD